VGQRLRVSDQEKKRCWGPDRPFEMAARNLRDWKQPKGSSIKGESEPRSFRDKMRGSIGDERKEGRRLGRSIRKTQPRPTEKRRGCPLGEYIGD